MQRSRGGRLSAEVQWCAEVQGCAAAAASGELSTGVRVLCREVVSSWWLEGQRARKGAEGDRARKEESLLRVGVGGRVGRRLGVGVKGRAFGPIGEEHLGAHCGEVPQIDLPLLVAQAAEHEPLAVTVEGARHVAAAKGGESGEGEDGGQWGGAARWCGEVWGRVRQEREAGKCAKVGGGCRTAQRTL